LPSWPVLRRASTCARSAAAPTRSSSRWSRCKSSTPRQSSSSATFQSVAITAEGADLDAAGLKRPSATSTYLVQDNPFGTYLDRVLRRLAPRSR
jgi:hypothetical protein